MIRATASGETAHIDRYGRIIATVPQYSQQYLIADIAIAEHPRTTLYTRWGDWFPIACLLVLLIPIIAWIVRQRQR